MRAISLVLVLAVAVSFGLVGCSDTTDPIVTPTSQPEAVSLEKGPAVHVATGNALLWLNYNPSPPPMTIATEPKGDFLRSFTFNAKLWPDGTSSGTLKEQGAPAPEWAFQIKAEVTQLLVDGNKAKIMGVLHDPSGTEIHCGFVVTDNGEGSNAELDRTTWLMGDTEANMQFMYEMSVDEALAWFWTVGATIGYPGEMDLYLGNVQVR